MAPIFYSDVLTALAGAGVGHVIVGGVAVNLQGVPRFTSNLAVAIEGPSLAAAAAVLERLGLRCRMALTFVDPVEPLREVNLVIASPVPYEEIERDADRVKSGSLEFKVASIDVLIRMKSGTGRAQDASDVDALRRIQESLRGR